MDKIKTWQERANEVPTEERVARFTQLECMRDEIADLRAALAASATTEQPSGLAAPVDAPIGTMSDWTLPRLYDLACRQQHAIREGDKCIKRYEALAADLRAALASQPAAQEQSEFAPYLKEGETPIERLKREIKECHSLLNLLIKGRRRFEFLHSTNVDAEGWEWGVARIRVNEFGEAEYLWGLSDHSDIDAAAQLAQSADKAEGDHD